MTGGWTGRAAGGPGSGGGGTEEQGWRRGCCCGLWGRGSVLKEPCLAVCRCWLESPLYRSNQGFMLRRAAEGQRGGQDALPELDGISGGTHVGEGRHGQGFVGRDGDGRPCPIAKAALGGMHNHVAQGCECCPLLSLQVGSTAFVCDFLDELLELFRHTRAGPCGARFPNRLGPQYQCRCRGDGPQVGDDSGRQAVGACQERQCLRTAWRPGNWPQRTGCPAETGYSRGRAPGGRPGILPTPLPQGGRWGLPAAWCCAPAIGLGWTGR